MKKMTCGHLLRVSLIQKRLGEKGVNIHDMTLPEIQFKTDCTVHIAQPENQLSQEDRFSD